MAAKNNLYFSLLCEEMRENTLSEAQKTFFLHPYKHNLLIEKRRGI